MTTLIVAILGADVIGFLLGDRRGVEAPYRTAHAHGQFIQVVGVATCATSCPFLPRSAGERYTEQSCAAISIPLCGLLTYRLGRR